MDYSDIVIKDKSSLDELLALCKKIGGTSIEFDFTDSERNGCNILIGGNEVVYHIDIEEARHVVDLKRKLGNYENSIKRMLSVSQYQNYFIVRPNNKSSLVDVGYDKVHVKMIESSIFRRMGLVVISSDKADTIPFTMKTIYKMLKNKKPNARISYITDRDSYIDYSSDIIFVEASEYSSSLLEKIARGVAKGVQVFIGIEAANAMMSLEALKNNCAFIDDEKLSSFNFLNCMIHQKSLPLICSNCSIKVSENRELDTEMAYRLTVLVKGGNEDVIEDSYADFSLDDVRTSSPKGCHKCHNGHVSETFCVEVIIPDYNMLTNIRECKQIEAWKCWRKYHGEGFVGMRAEDHAILKMGKGIVDPSSIEDHMEHLNIQLLLEDGTLTSEEVSSMIAPVMGSHA